MRKMQDSPVVQHLRGKLKKAEGKIQEMSGDILGGKVKQMEGEALENIAKYRANYHNKPDIGQPEPFSKAV